MIVTTMNDIPGYVIDEVYGEVMGLTVRSRNLGSQLGAGFKSMLGGELKGMTKALVDSREQVRQRMIDEAEAKGANAIVAMRFDTSEMGGAVDGDLRVRHGRARAQGVTVSSPVSDTKPPSGVRHQRARRCQAPAGPGTSWARAASWSATR